MNLLAKFFVEETTQEKRRYEFEEVVALYLLKRDGATASMLAEISGRSLYSIVYKFYDNTRESGIANLTIRQIYAQFDKEYVSLESARKTAEKWIRSKLG